MPATLSRGAPSRATVAAVYDDLSDLIYDTASEFARRYNQDAEECVGDAHIIFMKAYRTYDPSRGRLEPRVKQLIWCRLLDKMRQKATRYQTRLDGGGVSRKRGLTENDLVPGFDGSRWVYSEVGAVPSFDQPEFDREEFYADLTEDGETVARLFLECPDEIRDALLATNTPSEPGTFRAVVRRRLAAMGWDGRRVAAAFAEIAAHVGTL